MATGGSSPPQPEGSGGERPDASSAAVWGVSPVWRESEPHFHEGQDEDCFDPSCPWEGGCAYCDQGVHEACEMAAEVELGWRYCCCGRGIW